jgi:hypothetical protein
MPLIVGFQRRSNPRFVDFTFSEEYCISKAVSERGLSQGSVGLADATAEDETTSRWADCAVAYGD